MLPDLCVAQVETDVICGVCSSVENLGPRGECNIINLSWFGHNFPSFSTGKSHIPANPSA